VKPTYFVRKCADQTTANFPDFVTILDRDHERDHENEMKIHNFCKYAPSDIVDQLKYCLSIFDPTHLEGIGWILLFDSHLDLSYPRNSLPEWMKEGLETNTPFFGRYVQILNSNETGFIVLSVMDFLNSVPVIFRWRTVSKLQILRTLAHEVGHHVFATQENYNAISKQKDKEEFANLYATEVIKKMLGKWRYRLANRVIKELACWHYSMGIIKFRENQYAASADHYLKAWELDPYLYDAGSRYLSVRNMIDSKT
jgi:hypothetical protein